MRLLRIEAFEAFYDFIVYTSGGFSSAQKYSATKSCLIQAEVVAMINLGVHRGSLTRPIQHVLA